LQRTRCTPSEPPRCLDPLALLPNLIAMHLLLVLSQIFNAYAQVRLAGWWEPVADAFSACLSPALPCTLPGGPHVQPLGTSTPPLHPATTGLAVLPGPRYAHHTTPHHTTPHHTTPTILLLHPVLLLPPSWRRRRARTRTCFASSLTSSACVRRRRRRTTRWVQVGGDGGASDKDRSSGAV